MSNSVDNRVVSMEFDNAKFERNVAQSLETLKHLDKSLDGLTNSSKRFDGVSFEDVANSIESLANRFTLGGRIIQKVFDDIAQGIVNIGHKLINFSTANITAGWDKYAEKTTSVQTIMNATGQSIEYVEEQLDRLNRFTDETSYNFSDMTSNIAKFTSQGIELDTAVTQMQGIATWAASAGQNAQAASRAMYNISQAMGAGSMKLIDWKSIQNANMATKEFKEQAIAAGLAAETLVEQEGKIVTANGGIEVSVQNFEQTLQKGWFNTAAMQRVFTEYGKFADVVDEVSSNTDITVSELLQLAEAQENSTTSAESAAAFEEKLAEAANDAGMDVEELRTEISKLNAEELRFSKATYKAAQEAKTFADAVDATKDAVSTAWMNVFQTIFGNYEESRHLWTDMANWWYDIFAEPVNSLKDTLDAVMGGSRQVSKASNVVTRSIEEILSATGVKADQADGILTTVLKKSGLLTDEMIQEAGSAEAAIAGLTGSTGNLKNVIDEMLDSNTAGAKTASESLEEYRKIARDILDGNWGNGHERRDALKAAGLDPVTAQVFADLMHEGIGTTEADLWRLGETANNLTEEQIEALTKIQQALADGDTSIEELMDTMDVFENKYADWTGRELLFGRTEERRGAIYDIMDIINSIGDAISNAWSSIFQIDKVGVIRTFLENFKAFTQSIKDGIGDGSQLERTFKGLFAVLDIGKTAFSAVFSGFKQVIGLFVPAELGLGGMAASLGDWLVGVRDWIKNNKIFEKGVSKVVGVFKSFNTAIQPAVNKVKELWKTFKENKGVKETTSFFSNIFTVAIKGATAVVTKLGEGFGKLTDGIVDLYNKYLAKYVGQFVNFISQLANGTKSIIDVFNSAKSAVVDFFKILFNFIKNRDYEQFTNDLRERFSGLADALGGIGTKILNGIGWLFNVPPETAKTIVKLSIALAGLIGVLKIFKRLTSISSAITNFFNTLSSGIKAFVFNYKVNTVLKIAAAIVVLVGAMYAITKIPTDDLQRAKTTLFEIMGLFALLTALVSAGMIWGNPATSAAFAGAIIAMAAAIAAAVGALWVLTTKVDYAKLGDAYLALFAVMSMMVVAMLLLTRYAGKATISAMGMLAFAGSVLLMVLVLQKIQNSSTTIKSDAFAKLFGILAALAIMSLALKGVRLSSALGMLLFVASLRLMSKMLEKFVEEIPPADKILSKLEDLLVIFGLLLALAVIARIAGGGGLKMAISLIAVIGAIYVLAKVAAEIGTLPAAQLAKGTAVVIALGLLIGAIVWLMQTSVLLGNVKKGTTVGIIALVAAIVALGIELLVLSVIPWENLKGAIAAIGVVLGGLAIVLFAMGQMSKNFKGSAIAGLVEGIILLGGVFGALYLLSTKGNPETLISTAEALGLVMVALAGSLILISHAKFEKTSLGSVITMIVDTLLIMVPAMAALAILQHFNIQASLPTVAALGLVMLALAASVRIMSGAKVDWRSAISQAILVVALAGSLILVGMAMQKLNDVNVEGIIPKAVAMSILIGTLGGIAALLGQMKSFNFMSALKGVTVMAIGMLEFLTVMVIAMGEFALLAYGLVEAGIMQKLSEFSGVIVEGFGALGGALGNFIGQFVGELISGALQGLAGISSFAEALEPLMDQLERFDATSIAAVDVLVQLILALTAQQFLDALDLFAPIRDKIQQALGTDMASKLEDLGKAITGYVDTLSGYSPEDINKVARITTAMSNLFKSFGNEGSFFHDLFVGTQSQGMANLSKNLTGDEGFSAAIKGFVESVRGISDSDVQSVEKVNQIVTKISAMMDSIGTSGGMLQQLTGESNIAVFGMRALEFVRALVGGDGPNGHAEGIFELAEKIPDDTSSLDKLGTVTEALKNAVKDMPEMGGFIEKIFGSDSPSTFGEEMKEYVMQMVEIGKRGAELTEGVLQGLGNVALAATAMKAINEAVNGGPETGDGESKFDLFGTLSGGIDKLGAAATKTNLPQITTNLTNLGTSATRVFNLPGADASWLNNPNFGAGATEGITDLTEVLESAGVNVEDFMTDASTAANDGGAEVTTSMSEGMESGAPAVAEAAKNTSTSATEPLDAAATSSYTSGANYALGFAAGILEHISDVEAAVQQMAAAANTTLSVTIDAHSPSRIAEGRGENYTEGFAIGISKKKSLVQHATEGMANTAISAVQMAGQLIDDILATDGQPTITPVLDLSEVRNGVRSISNLGSFNASVSAKTVGAVSLSRDAMVASKIQNGTPAPVTAVLSESAARALAGSHSAQQTPVIEFSGDLAQLARILQPHIKMQDNYHGKSLVR